MMNKLAFTPDAWNDYEYWEKQDKKTLKKIRRLLTELQRHPLEGSGKPEMLKGDLAGCWSRRIDSCNRVVYQTGNDTVTILALRTHYGQ